MFQKFRPLNNNIWVKLIQEEERTAGGLYMPDSSKNEAQIGIVEAVGQGAQIKVGDKIFFGKHVGTKAGDQYVVIKEEDVLGIVGAIETKSDHILTTVPIHAMEMLKNQFGQNNKD